MVVHTCVHGMVCSAPYLKQRNCILRALVGVKQLACAGTCWAFFLFCYIVVLGTVECFLKRQANRLHSFSTGAVSRRNQHLLSDNWWIIDAHLCSCIHCPHSVLTEICLLRQVPVNFWPRDVHTRLSAGHGTEYEEPYFFCGVVTVISQQCLDVPGISELNCKCL